MLTIDLAGARALLDLLRRIGEGHPASELELEEVLATNAYFVDFYSRWDGCNRETIKQAIRHLNQPERVPSGTLPTRLVSGFRQAVDQIDLLESRMSWLSKVEASEISERVLAFLPEGTPLDSTIHITVDAFNNAFAYQGEMGVSLLKGMADRKTFEEAVAHELHHVGLQFWSNRDRARQALLQERSGRAVAVLHVQNLLAEGMANYYLSPRYVFREPGEEPPAGTYQARLARLEREQEQLYLRAEAILAMSLADGAEYTPCLEAFKGLALDMDDAMLPAAHYLGARMVQTMEQVHPRDLVVKCVCCLREFLPLYNAAASQTAGFVFPSQTTDLFVRLWDAEA